LDAKGRYRLGGGQITRGGPTCRVEPIRRRAHEETAAAPDERSTRVPARQSANEPAQAEDSLAVRFRWELRNLPWELRAPLEKR
jgi:hypothetical protein